MDVRRLRLKAGITQRQLASYVGVTRGAISQYETGLTEPSGETLKKLEEVLGPFQSVAGLVSEEAAQYTRAGFSHRAARDFAVALRDIGAQLDGIARTQREILAVLVKRGA